MSSETEINVNSDTVPNDDGQNTSSQEPLYTQDELTRIVKREVAKVIEKRPAPEEVNALKARLAEYEQAQMSEQEKLQAKIKELETKSQEAELQAKAAQLESLRLQVATEKGLPAPLAGRLNGATKEELEADADGLLEMFKLEKTPRTAPNLDGGKGTRQNVPTNNATQEDIAWARKLNMPIEKYLERQAELESGANVNDDL